MIAVLLMTSPVTYSHHSITAVYDGSRSVTVEGLVTGFEFINPHPFLVVAVRNEQGATQSWRMEMDNRSELARIGMTETTFKAGDRVVVSGSPGRRQPQSLYIRRLDRAADGLKYEQVGGTPRIERRGAE